jgi:NTE family protein
MPNTINHAIERTVVFDAGGVAGMAWTTGLVYGLKHEECDISKAEVLIGSSLSALLAAQIHSGIALDKLFSMQALASTPHSWQSVTSIESYRILELWSQLIASDTNSSQENILDILLKKHTTFTPLAWKKIISEHIFMLDWSERALQVVATDCESGQLVIFDKLSGVSLLDAIAASSATPGLVDPIKIDGRYYTDGGLHSAKSIAFAAGAQKIIIISPMGTAGWPINNKHYFMQVEKLKESGSDVMFITPDYPSRIEFEDNPFLIQTRAHTAEAGFIQGRKLPEDIKSFWLGR